MFIKNEHLDVTKTDKNIKKINIMVKIARQVIGSIGQYYTNDNDINFQSNFYNVLKLWSWVQQLRNMIVHKRLWLADWEKTVKIGKFVTKSV